MHMHFTYRSNYGRVIKERQLLQFLRNFHTMIHTIVLSIRPGAYT